MVNTFTFVELKYRNTIAIGIFLFILVLLYGGCRKERFFSGPGSLSFSTDTVYFDTVFTRLPGGPLPRSGNLQLVVRNTENKTVKTDIRLAGGTASPYRINIDGQSVTELSQYEIRGKDSIFIFVECILEANNQTNPMIVVDSIEFNTQGKRQDVKLAAYGWDAYYYNDSILPCNTVWDKTDKPYVVVNSVAVDRNCKLTINKGVHIYSSANSKILVLGTLEVNGVKDEEVIFEGNRLQFSYRERPGQWQGIHLIRESKDNQINYAIIKNATTGVQVDSLSINANPILRIRNTKIRNMTNYGIVGLTAEIRAENCLIHSCGFQAFAGFFGGIYDIRHCTFYGFSSTFVGHQEPVFSLSNFLTDGNNNIIRVFDVQYTMANNLMYGSLENEVSFAFAPSKPPLPSGFEKNLIRVKEPANYNPANNLINLDPLLKDPTKGNFTLANNSPAIDAGLTGTGVTADIDGKFRDANPDIGAYEF